MSKVLIVVDFQNDFITGVLGTPEARAIAPGVIAKIREFADNGDGIIFTADCHFENSAYSVEEKTIPRHCINGTDGERIYGGIDEEIITGSDGAGEDLFFTSPVPRGILPKMAFGIRYWDSFEHLSEIEICGLCTDICVVSNALILRTMFPAAKITVHADLCAGTTPEKHRAALEVMKSCLIEVV